MSEDHIARVAQLPLREPAADAGLMEVFRRRYLLRLLVSRELKGRYLGSYFGFLWSYINPFFRFLVFWFVFGILFERGHGMHNYAIHLFAGMCMVHFFSESYQAGMRSLRSNKSLINRMAMPKEMFPVASTLVSFYHTIPKVLILIAACVITGWRPDPMAALAFVLAIGIAGAFGLALGLAFSVLSVLYDDFGRVIATLSMAVPFSVPMVYPYEMVPDRFGTGTLHSIYMLNPMVESVLLMQRAFWATTHPNNFAEMPTSFPPDLFLRGWVFLAVCLVLLAIAQWIFRRLEHRIPEML